MKYAHCDGCGSAMQDESEETPPRLWTEIALQVDVDTGDEEISGDLPPKLHLCTPCQTVLAPASAMKGEGELAAHVANVLLTIFRDALRRAVRKAGRQR